MLAEKASPVKYNIKNSTIEKITIINGKEKSAYRAEYACNHPRIYYTSLMRRTQKQLKQQIDSWSREAKTRLDFFQRISCFLNDEEMLDCLRKDLGSLDLFFMDFETAYGILNKTGSKTRDFLICSVDNSDGV